MAQFHSEFKKGVHIIHCPNLLDSFDGKLEAIVKSWLIMEIDIHILDFQNVSELKQSAYRPFILFTQGLKTNSKKLFCLNVSAKLYPQIVQDGMSSIFEQVKNIDEAVHKLQVSNAAKPAIDVEFINPFIMATQKVMETQAHTAVVAGRPYVKPASENLPMEIAGVISLSNPAFSGSISLCFRTEVFLKVYENMVGEKHREINPEIEDAAGELLNIIFGQAKTILNDQKGYTLEKALPTILVGEKVRLKYATNAPVIILPFDCSVGTFYLVVVVERN